MDREIRALVREVVARRDSFRPLFGASVDFGAQLVGGVGVNDRERVRVLLRAGELRQIGDLENCARGVGVANVRDDRPAAEPLDDVVQCGLRCRETILGLLQRRRGREKTSLHVRE